MRNDNIGIFWQDVPTQRGKNKAPRALASIPETGWTPPAEFPNLSGARALSIDVETKDPELLKRGPGWARHRGHIAGLAVGTDDGGRWYFPMRHEIGKEQNLDPDHVLAWARDTLSNPRQPKIGANISYDIGWLREEGVPVLGDLFDVQFAEALLDELGRSALDTLGQKYLNQGKTSDVLHDWCKSSYGGPDTHWRSNIYRAPPSLVGPYAEGDVDLPFHVMNKQWPLLIQQGLADVFHMECQLIPLIVSMRFAGVRVDIPGTEELIVKLEKEIEGLERDLRVMVGFEVNVGSPESLARVFDQFGIGYTLTKKTQKPSFRKGFLESIDHPVGALINLIRARKKLVGTFLKSYIIDSHVDGKVYGSFNQLKSDDGGARSGRYSSSNPNLQNIPFRSALGKLIRRLFLPDIGHYQWRKSDYSQIEYRALAHYAVGPGSDEVRSQYNSDPRTDFHKLVQSIIFELTGLLGGEDDRPVVKNINFGTVYGMGEPTMAGYLNLPMAQAKQLLGTIHEAAPFLKSTMNATIEEARQLGYITTIMGRRSRFDLWEPSNYDDRKWGKPLRYELAVLKYINPQRAYLHKALNRRLQGSAADLMKMAMLKCWKAGLFDVVGVPRLTVHDELDFSDPGGHDEVFREIEHVMETAIPFRVPILVETEIGPNWGEVKKTKRAA